VLSDAAKFKTPSQQNLDFPPLNDDHSAKKQGFSVSNEIIYEETAENHSTKNKGAGRKQVS